MTFAHPWVLLLLALPVLLMWTVLARSAGVVSPADHTRHEERRWLSRVLTGFDAVPLLLLAITIVILANPQTLQTPKRERSLKMGITDPKKIYDMKELASGDVIVCATGVTDGALLKGVKFGKHFVETETVIYRSVTGTVRKIQGEHRDMAKFRLD